ncbi:MAG: YlxM family DNA-binding protein [Firmicutes bacterium]|nr:YlxM family DNA-binding protein [Bacillota bacterium]
MQKFLEINLLYDFYGKLLTKRQSEFIELYYNHDLSLGEIAEQYSISRQGVYDILKRAEKILENYEKKLGLVEKFQLQKQKLSKLYKMLVKLQNVIEEKEKALEEINRIKEYLEEVI